MPRPPEVEGSPFSEMMTSSVPPESSGGSPLLIPGRNCWQRVPCRRAAFLVDGEAYFSALASAVEKARHSVLILGWDIDSRIRLRRGKEGAPELGSFLNTVAAQRGMHVYVLDWDFAMLYALEREPLPLFKFGWGTHRRLHFHLDDKHPVGASHHQKIVVVDDRVAFVGGFDLASSRWDTPEHLESDPRRQDNGEPYPPFHDVQLLVDGSAAQALGTLARERWHRATGERIKAPRRVTADPWPDGITPDLQEVEIGISRTEPAYNGYSEVREVQSLHLDAIASARSEIYIENQYFTSALIAEALAARLQEDNAPEVLLVLPRECSGWLEETTMGVLRARVLEKLRKADRHGRLGVFYPHREGLSHPINVHSKILIVDDRLLRIGSSNLSNRSMGLDTECDLSIEANRTEVAEAVTRFRNSLMAEHLGTTQEQVQAAVAQKGLLGAVSALQNPGRTLTPLEGTVEKWLDQLIPERSLVDPEQPMSMERFIEEFMEDSGPSAPSRSRRRLGVFALILLVSLGMAAAWRWTPLKEWLDLQTLKEWGALVRSSPWALVWVVGAFVLGGVLMVPVTLLILVTALTFPVLEGSVYALAGCVTSACLMYALGQFMGRDTVRALAGARLNRLSRQMARRGLLAVIIVRFLPIAPFTVVNLVAGASHIRFFDFALGTVLGMGPGVLAITAFESSLEEAIREPDPRNFLILTFVTILVVLLIWGLRKWLAGKRGVGAVSERGQDE